MCALRNAFALGYVVDCDVRRANGTLGLRTVVESQYPLAVVHGTVERSLDDLDPYLSSLSAEALEAGRQAAASARREDSARMRAVDASAWREVAEQTYHFYRCVGGGGGRGGGDNNQDKKSSFSACMGNQ